MQILELIRRCPYCKRENKVSALSFAENPFCNACLHERMQNAKDEIGPGTWEPVPGTDGKYIRFVPDSTKGTPEGLDVLN
jgi:hypothetical protein